MADLRTGRPMRPGCTTGPAAVLPCIVDHAVEGYGPVLGALNDTVEEVEEAIFSSSAESRSTERIYQLSR